MAIQRKGTGSGSTSSGSPSTSSFDCTGANVIVVWVGMSNRTTQTITSVTDDEGNTYSQVVSPVDGGEAYGTFYIATGITTSTTLVVTANISGSSAQTMVQAVGYSNVNQSTPTAYAGSDKEANVLNVTITPDSAGDALIMGYIFRTRSSSVTVGSDQTKIGDQTATETISGVTEELAAGAVSDTQSAEVTEANYAVCVAFALVEAPSLVTLTTQGSSHNHSADSKNLRQSNILASNDSSHNHTSESVNLLQKLDLIVSSSSHTHISENTNLLQSNVLQSNDSLHGHASDNISLSQGYVLTTESSSHTHTSDNISLLQGYELTVDGSSHAHASDIINLSQGYVLVTEDSIHAHVAENVSVTQSTTLVANSATHSHYCENTTLIQKNTLAARDSLHGHTPESPNLSEAATLTVSQSTHDHTAESPSIAQAHQLYIQDSGSSHTAENITLSIEAGFYLNGLSFISSVIYSVNGSLVSEIDNINGS